MTAEPARPGLPGGVSLGAAPSSEWARIVEQGAREASDELRAAGYELVELVELERLRAMEQRLYTAAGTLGRPPQDAAEAIARAILGEPS